MRSLVLLFFFISGVCGLLYEVVWIRAAGTVIGNTTYAIGTVVGIYMGGLALGARLGGRAADRRGGASLLRLYGVLEGGIALTSLAVPLLLACSEPIFRVLWNTVGEITLLYAGLRAVLIAVVLVVPTTLMGMTLPLLSRYLSDTVEDAAVQAGRAYAVNTLGGVVGTLLSGFWLVPSFGLRATTAVAGLLNLAIAGAAIAAARGRGRDIHPTLEAGPPPHRLALAVSALSGFAALIYEVAWTRCLVITIGSTVYAFTLILAMFILGLAAGSALGARYVSRRKDPLSALVIVQALIGVLAIVFLPILGDLPVRVISLVDSLRSSYGKLMAAEFLLVFPFVFLPTFLLGSVFPLVCRLGVGTEKSVGRSVGAIYTWNTLGSIAGTLLASFGLLPAFGISAAIRVGATVNLLGALLLLPALPRGRRLAWTVVAAALLGAWLVPSLSDTLMSSGAYLNATGIAARAREEKKEVRDFLEETSHVLYRYWDSYGLVTVHQAPSGEKDMRVNGKTDASSAPADMTTQLCLGHLPMLHHPNPKRALVIGLGAGVTLGAVARHPVERIECVEISSAVAAAAEHFSDITGGVLHDPRVHLVIGDGRNALLFGREPFDVIISEPSNLWISGMATLFTRESFEQAARRLAPGGIFCQWIHAFHLPAEDFRRVFRTFFAVYPHGGVWEIEPANDYLLLGSLQPLKPSYAAMEHRMADPGIAADFAPRLAGLGGLAGLLVADAGGARTAAGPGSQLTDDHCSIEYSAAQAIYRDTSVEILAFLEGMRSNRVEHALYADLPPGAAEEIARRREARRFLALATRLRALEDREGFAQALEGMSGAMISEPDTLRFFNSMALKLGRDAVKEFEAGHVGSAIGLMSRTPRNSSAYVPSRVMLADMYKKSNRREDARRCYAEALSLQPRLFAAAAGLAAMIEEEGDWADAISRWEQVVLLQPRSVPARVRLASCLLKASRNEEARRQCIEILRIDPANAEAARLLGRVGSP
jgi:spermidine synthase